MASLLPRFMTLRAVELHPEHDLVWWFFKYECI